MGAGDLFANIVSALNLLEWFTWLNWLTHPERRTGRLRGAHQLAWPRSSKLSGLSMERALKRYHIPVWGRAVIGKKYVCWVPGQQAEWAEYLLRRRLEGGPLPQPSTGRRARSRRRAR